MTEGGSAGCSPVTQARTKARASSASRSPSPTAAARVARRFTSLPLIFVFSGRSGMTRARNWLYLPSSTFGIDFRTARIEARFITRVLSFSVV